MSIQVCAPAAINLKGLPSPERPASAVAKQLLQKDRGNGTLCNKVKPQCCCCCCHWVTAILGVSHAPYNMECLPVITGKDLDKRIFMHNRVFKSILSAGVSFWVIMFNIVYEVPQKRKWWWAASAVSRIPPSSFCLHAVLWSVTGMQKSILKAHIRVCSSFPIKIM